MFNSRDNLSLVYFTANPLKARDIIQAGADAIFVDCESLDKYDRQIGFNTEINNNTPDDVGLIRKINPSVHIICRVNNDFEGTTEPQIESAIINGANSIIIPMVEDAKQIIRLLRSEERRVGKECRSRWSPYH